MKNSKFNSLFQEAYSRFTNGNGFLVGDVVKMKSGYESVEGYKSLGENVKERVKDMLKSGNNIRIGRLHNTTASRYNADGSNSSPAQYADCYEEYAPGMVTNLITLPIECLEEVDTGANLPPIPEGQKDEEERVSEPKEFGKHGWHENKKVNTQNKLGAKQNWVEKGNYELATKNTKLAHSNKYNDALPPKIKGLGKVKEVKESALVESENLLNSLYLNILNEDMESESNHMLPQDLEDEGNEFTGDLAHTKKGDKFEIGGKKVTNTTGTIAEEVCPICGMDVCKCNKEESEVKDESGLQAYIGKKKYGTADFKALQQAGRDHDEKKKEQIKHKHSKQAISEDISLKAPKTFLPGGDPKTTEIKAGPWSHQGG